MYYLDEDIIVTIYPSGATKDLICPYTIYRIDGTTDTPIFYGNCFIQKGQSAVYFRCNDIIESQRWNPSKTNTPKYRSLFDIPQQNNDAITGLIDTYKIVVKAEKYTVTSDKFQVASVYRYPFYKSSLNTDMDEMCNCLYGNYNNGKSFILPPHIPYVSSSTLPFTTVINNFTYGNDTYAVYLATTNTEEYDKIWTYDGRGISLIDASIMYYKNTTDNIYKYATPIENATEGDLQIVQLDSRNVNCFEQNDKDFIYGGDTDYITRTSTLDFQLKFNSSSYNVTSIVIGYDGTAESTITPTESATYKKVSATVTIGDVQNNSGVVLQFLTDNPTTEAYYLFAYIDYSTTTLKKGDTVTLAFMYQLDNTYKILNIRNLMIYKQSFYTYPIYYIAKVDFCPKDYYIFWQDRLGGIQCQPFNKILTYSEDVEHKEIVSYDGYRSVGNSVVQPKWKLNTDWIPEKYYPVYESIMISQYIRLYDVKENKFYECLITDTDYTEKTFQNQQKTFFNLTINLEMTKTQNILF